MKKIYWIIGIVLIIGISALSFYLFSYRTERIVDVGLKLSIEDVTYTENDYTDETKDFINDLIILDAIYQNFTLRTTNQNWSTIIYKSYDNNKMKYAATTLLIVQQAFSSLEHTFLNGLIAEDIKNITDEEWLSLNITRLDSDNLSKENILRLIENLKTIENFYLKNGLNFVMVDINRLNFLYNYINKVDLPEDDFTIYNYEYKQNMSFENLIKGIIKQYNSIYDGIMTRLDILEVKDKTITIKNIGLLDIETEEIDIRNSDYDIVNCEWSKSIINPNSTTFCILGDSCILEEKFEISYLVGSKEFYCSS